MFLSFTLGTLGTNLSQEKMHCENCLCQKAGNKIKEWVNNNIAPMALILFFILGIEFLILGSCPHFKNDFFTASGSLFAASTLLYAICCYQIQKKKTQNSISNRYRNIFRAILNSI